MQCCFWNESQNCQRELGSWKHDKYLQEKHEMKMKMQDFIKNRFPQIKRQFSIPSKNRILTKHRLVRMRNHQATHLPLFLLCFSLCFSSFSSISGLSLIRSESCWIKRKVICMSSCWSLYWITFSKLRMVTFREYLAFVTSIHSTLLSS